MAGSETSAGRTPGQTVQGADDLVVPFSTDKSGIRGRVVRMGGVVDTILSRHDYPEAVSEALGQALALTAMLGQPLKPGGRLGFQTRTDGPIRFLLADYEARGYPVRALRHNKYWSPVGRVDNVWGDRNLMCSCPPLSAYES